MSVLFPKWMNVLPTVAAIGAVSAFTGVVGGFWYYATPKFFKVGYMPTQPGTGFNHQIHAGKLGMDCRYCHTKVEKSYEANIPNVQTCYGCHAESRLAKYTDETHKTKTNFIREAYATDKPIEWRRVHKVPDYVHNFPHHAHLNAGISCYSCHGRIDTMPVVYQAKPMSMGWCLECHRAPEKNMVDPKLVTNLRSVASELADREAGKAASVTNGKTLVDKLQAAPPQNCGACHY